MAFRVLLIKANLPTRYFLVNDFSPACSCMTKVRWKTVGVAQQRITFLVNILSKTVCATKVKKDRRELPRFQIPMEIEQTNPKNLATSSAKMERNDQSLSCLVHVSKRIDIAPIEHPCHAWHNGSTRRVIDRNLEFQSN